MGKPMFAERFEINERTEIKLMIKIVIRLLKYLSTNLNITPAQKFRFESTINVLESKQVE